MQPNFIAVLIWSLYFYQVVADSNVKPSFSPYCLRLHICAGACRCRYGPGCHLLPMDDNTRNELLLFHNKIRHEQTKSNNPPSGLALLAYDIDLEEISSCWAARCSNDYSDCFQTPNFQEVSHSIGQIIIEDEEMPRVEVWLDLMNTWLSILFELPIGGINTAAGGREDIVEHNIAQILSDQILYMGCAWSMSKNWVTFVCSYGPRGPLRGDLIYRSGEVCSSCPEGYTCYEVKPFERLCKSLDYKEMQDSEPQEEGKELAEMDVIKKMRKREKSTHRVRHRAIVRTAKETPSKPSNKITKTAYIAGFCTLGSLIIFFTLVAIYVWVTSKLAPGSL